LRAMCYILWGAKSPMQSLAERLTARYNVF
jgi:hypothetical protein